MCDFACSFAYQAILYQYAYPIASGVASWVPMLGIIVSAALGLIGIRAALHKQTSDDARTKSDLNELEYRARVLRFLVSPEFEARISEIVETSARIKKFVSEEVVLAMTQTIRSSETIQALDTTLIALHNEVAEVRSMIFSALIGTDRRHGERRGGGSGNDDEKGGGGALP